MKRLSSMLVLLVLLALLAAPSVGAHPMKPLTASDHDIEVNCGGGFWEYDLEGDFSGTAEAYIDFSTVRFPGKTEHWTETMVIAMDGGGTVTIESKGVYNMNSQHTPKSEFKFRTNGVVTDATAPWEHLIGARALGSGYTTHTQVCDPTAEPIGGEFTLRLN